MKILLVDESSTARKMVRNALDRERPGGHYFREAESGFEGLEHVAEWQPGLIISDWNLPELGGLEFLRHLRGGDAAPPLYFLTAEASAENRALALAEGAQGVIAKPFRHDALLQALEPVLT